MSLAFVSGKDSLPVDLPKPIENEKTVEVVHSNVKPFSVHPLPLVCIITFCMLRKYLAQEYIGAHVHTLNFFLDNGIKKSQFVSMLPACVVSFSPYGLMSFVVTFV
jgi:hypothetical protein